MPWPGWDSAEITTQLCVSNYTHVTTRKSFLCFKFYVKYHRRGMQVEYHLWCLRSQTGWVWSLVLPVPFNLPVLHFSICQVELLPPPGNACMDFAESRVPVTQRKAWRMSALWLESLPWNLLFFLPPLPTSSHSCESLCFFPLPLAVSWQAPWSPPPIFLSNVSRSPDIHCHYPRLAPPPHSLLDVSALVQ